MHLASECAKTLLISVLLNPVRIGTATAPIPVTARYDIAQFGELSLSMATFVDFLIPSRFKNDIRGLLKIKTLIISKLNNNMRKNTVIKNKITSKISYMLITFIIIFLTIC